MIEPDRERGRHHTFAGEIHLSGDALNTEGTHTRECQGSVLDEIFMQPLSGIVHRSVHGTLKFKRTHWKSKEKDT
jgi:hypothetical protein